VRGRLLAALLWAPVKLKLFRGTLFLNDTNCMDESDIVNIDPSDRISVAVGTVHHYFIVNSMAERKVSEVLHGDNLAHAGLAQNNVVG
jgi:hypothetical protein